MKAFKGIDLYGNELTVTFKDELGDGLEANKELITLLLGYEPDDWESHVSEVEE